MPIAFKKFTLVVLLTLFSSRVIADDHDDYSRPIADLPELLRFNGGDPVCSMQDWSQRKKELRQLVIETFIGTFPEETPSIIKTEVLQEYTDKHDGSIRRQVKLYFDATNKIVSFDIWLWIPSGDGPFPLILYVPCSDASDTHDPHGSPSKYKRFGWAEEALSRGYLICLYPGVDNVCPESGYEGYESVYKEFHEAYPKASWTEISTKAWIASRCLDYLMDPKYGNEVAEKQVGIIGWSRYGKQSLLAAAFDERITSVVSRNSSTPVPTPYRFAGRQARMESPADTPDGWFLESLKSYYGRENELPTDGHAFLALIAPRRCMIDEAYNDGCGSTFATERAYLEARKVYSFLDRPENLHLHYRTGQHGPVTDEQRTQNIDWFDLSFQRGTARQEDFPESFIHKFDWEVWKGGLEANEFHNPFEDAICTGDSKEIKKRIFWALGKAPKEEYDGEYTFLSEEEDDLLDHDRWPAEKVSRMSVSFGGNVRGNVYYDPSRDTPAPVVIYLHPYSYHLGYSEGFGVQDYSSYKTGARGTTVYHWLASKGFVVLAYDQCGFGLRLLEGRDFYRNNPRWSRLGRMVKDVETAVDFLVDGKGKSKGPMPKLDTKQIFVLGYSMGGMVGLYSTALNERIAGVASFCGFTPMRTDTDEKSTGGIRRLWEWHALLPKIGVFNGNEKAIPYDYEDILTLISPRPCLVVAPKNDRDADINDIRRCMEKAEKVWDSKGKASNLTFRSPDGINRFQAVQQDLFLEWYQGLKASVH